ncbi:MAG: NAD(P)H-binding protein [Anaerolineae bacterium]|nr:NAD(P)H-binding protein [Anaerolineae bacterium]
MELPIGLAARRVIVIGATGFLGFRVVRALLDENAIVTAVVQPGTGDQLNVLANRAHIIEADVWNPASLKGRARNHAVLIHLIGGVKPDPGRGLTFRHLNFVSARNTMQMAVSDGVPHYMLLSAATAPIGISREYLESKREAESYLRKTGLSWTILRAPALYVPGGQRNPLYALLSAASRIPLVGLFFVGAAPLAVDTAARGIANLALTASNNDNRLIQPAQLRRAGRLVERRLSRVSTAAPTFIKTQDDEDEPPFGWLPPTR